MSSSTNNSKKEKKKASDALEMIKKWFYHSSSHDFRRVGRAETLLERLFWSYMLWISTILMSTFIAIIVIKYVTNPTKVHLSVQHCREAAHFPAITFCKTSLSSSRLNIVLLGNINPLRDDGFLNDFRKDRLPGQGRPSAPLNASEYRKAFAAYIDRILNSQAIGQVNPLVKWSYQLKDLLITCTFNRRLCFSNLTLLFHPNYGNCYTFDHLTHVQSKQIDPIRPDWSVDDLVGENNYKLYLELFLRQQEYNLFFDDRAAFRLFIHRKDEVPMLSQTSVFLAPNRYTKLSFSQRFLTFSQQCRADLTDEMKRIFSAKQVRYTQALCVKLCEQRFIEGKCRCIEPMLLVFFQFFSKHHGHARNGTPICSLDDRCLMNRTAFSKTRFREEKKKKKKNSFVDPRQNCRECLPECEIVQYRVQSSYATYPHVNAFEKVWQRVRTHFRLDHNVSAYLKQFESTRFTRDPILSGNILAVEISISPDLTEFLTESPVYTWVDLISSIGSQAGLWIGVSLINLMEIFELFYAFVFQ